MPRTAPVRCALRPGTVLLPALASGMVSGLGLQAGTALAQQSGYGQTMGTSPMERQLYDYGPGSGSRDNGSILDSTNPLDLMNRIRKSTSLDDATPPGAAIDQALREFEAQAAPTPKPGASGPARTVQGP